jgi:hypothetical protein
VGSYSSGKTRVYHRNLATGDLATDLPALYRLPRLPPIRRHIRLTVLDALVVVTAGGTPSPPHDT